MTTRLSNVRPEDFIGESTMRKVRDTKWWALARFLDEVLYNGHVETAEGRVTPEFKTPAKAHVSTAAEHVKVLGREGASFDVEKTLRELMHECERMAIKEST